jgi:NADPH:quinone reductase-like Zn-dependent oxidoreductase
LIAVRACGVNRLDLWVRSGTHPLKIPLPHILGAEIAGEVAAVGRGVENLAVGTPVVVSPYLHCGQCDACLAGHEETCFSLRIIGREVDGGYAEFALAPARNLIPLPPELPYEAAAAVALAALTAWHMLITRARVRAGETVLVLAAGSGVGSAAIQMAKLSGARVITTASRDEQLALARGLGADEAINYAQTDYRAAVMDLTHGRGVDVVCEHIGAATWDQSLGCLARNGRLVICGATTGGLGTVNLWQLFGRQQSVLGSYGGSRSELRTILDLVRDGRLRPVIHQTYPLDEAPAAHRQLEARRQFGKILLVTP